MSTDDKQAQPENAVANKDHECKGEDCADCDSAKAAKDAKPMGVDISEIGGYAASTESTGTGPKSMEECMGRSLESLSAAFRASARRWELIVYPALTAFIILAAYGFYLIYSLTKDVSRVADDMSAITANMVVVAQNMHKVAGTMDVISRNVEGQSVIMNDMAGNIRAMNASMQTMTASMDHLRYSMAVMNHSVSRPMSFMNSFMPW